MKEQLLGGGGASKASKAAAAKNREEIKQAHATIDNASAEGDSEGDENEGESFNS